MRIAVDFRILAVGREWINRGMGRFTQQQLAAVLAIDTENEYILVCPRGSELSLLKREIATSPAVDVREWPSVTDDSAVASDPASLLQRSERYEEWLYEAGVDVYHASTPFLLSEPSAADFTACPMVATFYDAIPLVYPAQYLEGWAEYDRYIRTCALLTRASRLLAISQSARRDAALYVGFPADRIDVGYPAADACFRPMPAYEVEEATRRLRSRTPLPARYALTVSHIHHTKNLATLLRGYSAVPAAVRRELPLLVCCHLDEHGVAYVQRVAAELGIAEDIVLTGLVTDDELAALYNGATMLVHPSRYEGFGLPVIEAMHCGTPVVTTTASSLPEVAGDAAVLVDPDDALGFADAMQELFEDPDRRQAMVDRGFMQVEKFGVEQLGAATLASYRAAAAPARKSTPDRPRVAMWTPLPPQKTGVADYSVELATSLRSSCDIELFVDDGYLPSIELLRRFRVASFTAFERRNAQQPFDAVLYQMGGSLFHYYMYEPLQKHRGITVLHDLVWSCVLYAHALSVGGGINAFRGEVGTLEGAEALAALESVESLPEDLAPDQREEALWDFLCTYPMLRTIVDCSVAQVVPFPTAAVELRRRYENAEPHTIPMGVADPYTSPPQRAVAVARANLDVAPETVMVGVFGIVHPFKRLESCIRAVASARREHPDVRLVIVGRALDPAYEDRLRILASSLGSSDHVTLTGHVSPEEFDQHLLAADVVVNLRFPFLKQMSATLMRAIAAGKPVVISDHPDWRFFPDDFCLRVDPDESEVANLTHHLSALAGDASRRERMAAAARSFYEREGTVGQMADRYLRLIQSLS